jgi:hypothetical protein
MNGLTCKKFLFKRVKYILKLGVSLQKKFLKFAKGVILTPNQREMLGSKQGCRSHGCGAVALVKPMAMGLLGHCRGSNGHSCGRRLIPYMEVI